MEHHRRATTHDRAGVDAVSALLAFVVAPKARAAGGPAVALREAALQLLLAPHLTDPAPDLVSRLSSAPLLTVSPLNISDPTESLYTYRSGNVHLTTKRLPGMSHMSHHRSVFDVSGSATRILFRGWLGSLTCQGSCFEKDSAGYDTVLLHAGGRRGGSRRAGWGCGSRGWPPRCRAAAIGGGRQPPPGCGPGHPGLTGTCRVRVSSHQGSKQCSSHQRSGVQTSVPADLIVVGGTPDMVRLYMC